MKQNLAKFACLAAIVGMGVVPAAAQHKSHHLKGKLIGGLVGHHMAKHHKVLGTVAGAVIGGKIQKHLHHK